MSRRKQLAGKPTLKRAGGALVLAGTLAALAGGCGETTKAPTTVASTTSQATATAPSSTTTGSQAPASAPPVTTPSSRGHQGATAPAGRSRRHPGSALSSLGNARPAPKLTASQRAHTSIADITLSSPAMASSRGSIPRQYTCDGQNHSLPLRWEGVPPGTKELAIFAIAATPRNDKLFFAWALAGINPQLTELQTGQTPPGAVNGQNSEGHAGYSICPPPGSPESYVFLVYALPQSLSPRPGFNAQTLHQQAIQTARHDGLLLGTYTRS